MKINKYLSRLIIIDYNLFFILGYCKIEDSLYKSSEFSQNLLIIIDLNSFVYYYKIFTQKDLNLRLKVFNIMTSFG